MRGLAIEETERLEKVFKRALRAYNNDNWYILYSIALQLGLELPDISEHHIKWVEEDIRQTLSEISGIANLVPWAWYTGDDDLKVSVIKYYFSQIYGLDIP